MTDFGSNHRGEMPANPTMNPNLPTVLKSGKMPDLQARIPHEDGNQSVRQRTGPFLSPRFLNLSHAEGLLGEQNYYSTRA